MPSIPIALWQQVLARCTLGKILTSLNLKEYIVNMPILLGIHRFVSEYDKFGYPFDDVQQLL